MKDFNTVWANIARNQGETFWTVRKIPFTYAVKDSYILINNDKKRRITKEHIQKAILIVDPSPAKIQRENIWGPTYVYGIIVDNRI